MNTLLATWLSLASFVALSLNVQASGEESVSSRLSEATITTLDGLTTNKGNYAFELKLDEKWSIAHVSAIYKGKTIAVPLADLPKINLVDLRQAHTRTFRKVASYEDPGTSVILIIPFEQEHRENPDATGKKESVRVSNVLRLLFHEGEMIRWEMATSLGEKSNGWKLTCKDKGEAVSDDGQETGLTNPYWNYNPINYSTSWSKEP